MLVIKRLLQITAVMMLVLITGCGVFERPLCIMWVDFIMFNDISYHDDGYNYHNSLSFDDLGPQFDTVNFRVADNVHTTRYSTKNGDAAYHDKGTPVYTITGYAPEFRLAIWRGGEVKIYEAYHNPKATTGADLLDIRNKVSFISINSEIDGSTFLGTIDEQAIVAEMVEMTLNAPLTDNCSLGNELRYFIAFHLDDGTMVNRSYWVELGLLAPNILLPEEFAEYVRGALNN